MMAAATSDQHKVQYLGGTKIELQSLGREGEDGKPLSDISELEYFDARSHISTQSPSEQPDSFDQNQAEDHSVPKIVETVVKLLDGKSKSGVLSVPVEDIYKNATESVIEREIRLQKEREDALIKEREEAFQRAAAASISQQQQQQQQQFQRSMPVVTQTAAKPSEVIKTSPPSEPSDSVFRSLTITTPSLVGTSSTPAETKIALEIREMREREEELRKLRQQILTSKDGTSLSTPLAEENLISIPNTDEGNFSEYGSEDKELSLDGNSCVMSPEVPTQSDFLHQRTQSLDSLSSGHSSGSGFNPENFSSRRRVVVKPFEEPDQEEVPSFMRKLKETPIEREIRLVHEREEELRREKGLPLNSSPVSTSIPKEEVRRSTSRSTMITNDPRSVQHRIATSRIQQEINEATEREIELRDGGQIQTTSEETLDSKVTRFTDLAEFAIVEQDRKMQKASSISNVLTTVTQETDIIETPELHQKKHTRSSLFSVNEYNHAQSQPSYSPTNSRTFSATFGPKGQKGLMERFLASHGKLPVANNSSLSISPISTSSQIASSLHSRPSLNSRTPSDFFYDDNQSFQEREEYERERQASWRTASRPRYTPAEEKIQVELKEMQKREEELSPCGKIISGQNWARYAQIWGRSGVNLAFPDLAFFPHGRLQRAHLFAVSQPNLMSIIEDEDNKIHKLNGGFNDTRTLRTTQSIPNLLDAEDSSSNEITDVSLNKPSFRNPRKRNSLIAEWESRITKNVDQ